MDIAVVEIRDSSKRERRIVDASREPKEPVVRVGGEVHDPVPFEELPAAIAEVVGRQVASLRALSRAGVQLTGYEVAALTELARTVSSIATAHKKLNDSDKPLDKMTEEELRAQLGK